VKLIDDAIRRRSSSRETSDQSTCLHRRTWQGVVRVIVERQIAASEQELCPAAMNVTLYTNNGSLPVPNSIEQASHPCPDRDVDIFAGRLSDRLDGWIPD
jgi:hypothetical protein